MMDGDQFFDADRNEMFFSAGTEDRTGHASRQELLEGIRNLDYYDHTVFGKMDREDVTVSSAVEAMVEMVMMNRTQKRSTSPMTVVGVPMGPKLHMFMLDLLDNLPRLRLSDDQLKTIIWVMRECGTPDIPSFSALRKKQAQLTKDVNIQTVRHVSAMGNEFYMNHPAQLLALDWANPLVREFMQVYPEITDHISEMNQADKWTKEDVLTEVTTDSRGEVPKSLIPMMLLSEHVFLLTLTKRWKEPPLFNSTPVPDLISEAR
ncbi:hypothetical protein B0H14DRAFT_3433567 [Mycena olivaceomarginata]|nr:hypothetical protein B0H14DRAFT_3433567 [Mycena olivaceomarginata]